MRPTGSGNDSGIENGRSFRSMGPLEKGESETDKQSQRNGGYLLNFSVFRNTLRTIWDQGNSDEIGQLFNIIQSKETEGSTTTSVWSQQPIQNNSTFGSIGTDSSRSKSNQSHRRFSEQIGQLWRLQHRHTIFTNPISLMEPRANSWFIRKPTQYDPTSLCTDGPEKLEWAMNWSIQQYMGERNPLDPSTYPNDTIDFYDIQTVINYSN
ncbi:MAG: hypothetical protein EZS28_015701 [Streblomastix strix]|uniref:Uncharacterized protein n=1 Tax=Streblomastix strix TaxID=222440 RepID=A0A5J4W286_9EUKA|nr:MAG: hypothetical protein EZS28_015701 [Streblomastix strix]